MTVAASEPWPWLYRVAADIPSRPSPKVAAEYREFFKALSTIIPDADDRKAYRSIVTKGPFKLATATFAKGPESALQWVVDVRNGIRLLQGKPPCTDFTSVWKEVRKSTRKTNNTNNRNEFLANNRNVVFLRSLSDLRAKIVDPGKLAVVLYDPPHFFFAWRDKKAAADLELIRSRYTNVVTAVVPGNVTFRMYFTASYYYRHALSRQESFPYFALYHNGRAVLEDKSIDKISAYLDNLEKRSNRQKQNV